MGFLLPARISDESLRQAVLLALAADPLTAGFNLRVGVLKGVAHLGGEAGSLESWNRAAQVAAEVPGVRAVANRIAAPGAPCPGRTIHLDLAGPNPD